MNLFLVTVLLAVASLSSGEESTSKFDDVDVDDIIKSDRLITSYSKCILDEGRCTPEAAELKRLLSDALHTKCKSCTKKQRTRVRKIVYHLQDFKPDIWTRILTKYDPDGTLARKYGLSK